MRVSGAIFLRVADVARARVMCTGSIGAQGKLVRLTWIPIRARQVARLGMPAFVHPFVRINLR
jgi:hypothetical protein